MAVTNSETLPLTMALFLNRTIQAFLQGCSSWMPPDQLERFISRLNEHDPDALSATWELALAHSLARYGEVEYEPRLGGRTFADFLFKVAPGVEFLSDVTIVSDKGLDEQNPAWEFAAALFRRARRYGIETKYISYEFGNAVVGAPGKAKILLKIPKKADFDVFLQQFLDSHLAEIRQKQPDRHEIHVTTETYDVHVFYDKRFPGASGKYRAYSTLLNLTANPIYNSLREKAQQLRDSNYSGIKGVFLCDAGSTSLKRRVSRMIDDSFSDEDIVWAFLRQNTSISFVQTYYIVQNREIFEVEPNIALRSKLFVSRTARMPLPEVAQRILREMPSVLPSPDFSNPEARQGF